MVFDVATERQGMVEEYNRLLHALFFQPQSILNRMDAVQQLVSFIRFELCCCMYYMIAVGCWLINSCLLLYCTSSCLFVFYCSRVKRPKGVEYKSNCFYDIEAIVATVKRQLQRQKQIQLAKKSVEQLTKENRWPKGGLMELRSHLDAGWSYFDSLVAVRQAGGTLGRRQLAFAFRYTIASLYAYEENARPMAIEGMALSGKCCACVLLHVLTN